MIKHDKNPDVIQLCIPLKYREGKGLIEIRKLIPFKPNS